MGGEVDELAVLPAKSKTVRLPIVKNRSVCYTAFIISNAARGCIPLILYHASKEIVPYPEVRKAKYTKDFSWGFYCTNNLEQAVRWANRGAGDPIINYYSYEPDDNLQILHFPEMTDDWLDFIAKCRNGETHTYDIVEGPMANDTIWNYVNDFLTGRINRKQFWVLAEFKYPTHQISFHTLSALNCLIFLKSEVIYDGKRTK